MESSALKMLAEVASATLKNDPSLFYNSNERKHKYNNSKINNNPTRKNVCSSDRLTLDQIRVLSDKMLIEMFSELICDEIRKNYSFKCYLIPDKCSQIFKSFGSEARARCKMKTHLQSHIDDLVSEYDGTTDNSFTAEPLHIRRKRQELHEKSIRKKKKSKQSKTKRKQESSSFDEYCNTDMNDFNFESQDIAFQNAYNSSTNNFNYDFDMCAAMNNNQNGDDTSSMHLPVYQEESMNAVQQYSFDNYFEDQTTDLITPPDNVNRKHHTRKKSKMERTCSKAPRISYDVNWNVDFDNAYLNNSSYSDFNSDSDYSNPYASFYHDHTYTSVDGVTYDVTSEENKYSVAKTFKETKKSQLSTYQPIVIPTPPFPYVYTPMLPFIAEIREVESASCSSSTSAAFSENTHESITVPSELHLRNSFEKDLECFDFNTSSPSEDELITDEDENSPSESFMDDVISENDSYSDPNNSGILNSTFIVDDILETDCPPNLQSIEKKLALKCIRALRTKKKDERGPLVCQICKNKSFTAQATLMYHYRSHAGIKPFSCTVCEATFTRQHSLNYHMLIHNNKSRFVCGDCGRNFRHPSHYKEHLRRHTGETPYQCTDCKFRFKTRNTYKRHLKTRHGKILSAHGIHSLSIEEFFKVRTSPRPKTHKSFGPKETYKTRWSEILFSEDFCI